MPPVHTHTHTHTYTYKYIYTILDEKKDSEKTEQFFIIATDSHKPSMA